MECCDCGKKPEEIQEYIDAAAENEMTPREYILEEEGTWNPNTNHFCCTHCYIMRCMPSSPLGWKAP